MIKINQRGAGGELLTVYQYVDVGKFAQNASGAFLGQWLSQSEKEKKKEGKKTATKNIKTSFETRRCINDSVIKSSV